MRPNDSLRLPRRALLAAMAVLVLGGLLPLPTRAADDAPAKRRNVVLIVADDLGFQAGCYGDRTAKTPGLDRLAADGVRFSRAHCTTSSCSASRSVLLTGLHNHATGHYGHAHGENHFSTYDSVRTLPVILGEAGYRTCSIGKYHVAPETTYHFHAYRNEGIQGARNSVRMARNARDFIAEKDDRPFFLYWCSSDPHRGGGPDGFANHDEDPDFYPGVKKVAFRPEDIPVHAWLPDRPEVRRELAAYYQAVARMDQGIAALLDALDATGRRDDTLVLFLSDNGPPFPGAKTTLYEPGANLPLLVRDPTRPQRRGTTTDTLVSWADVTPTILDWCGVVPKPAPPVRPAEVGSGAKGAGAAQPVKFHGRSFLAALDSEHPAGFDVLFASHTFHEITMYYPMRSVIEGRYKYVLNLAHPLPFPFASDLYASPTWQGVLSRKDETYGKRTVAAYVQRPRHELYDLQSDPDEIRNLAADPAHAARLKSLQDRLRTWQKETRDPWISKWEYE